MSFSKKIAKTSSDGINISPSNTGAQNKAEIDRLISSFTASELQGIEFGAGDYDIAGQIATVDRPFAYIGQGGHTGTTVLNMSAVSGELGIKHSAPSATLDLSYPLKVSGISINPIGTGTQDAIKVECSTRVATSVSDASDFFFHDVRVNPELSTSTYANGFHLSSTLNGKWTNISAHGHRNDSGRVGAGMLFDGFCLNNVGNSLDVQHKEYGLRHNPLDIGSCVLNITTSGTIFPGQVITFASGATALIVAAQPGQEGTVNQIGFLTMSGTPNAGAGSVNGGVGAVTVSSLDLNRHYTSEGTRINTVNLVDVSGGIINTGDGSEYKRYHGPWVGGGHIDSRVTSPVILVSTSQASINLDLIINYAALAFCTQYASNDNWFQGGLVNASGSSIWAVTLQSPTTEQYPNYANADYAGGGRFAFTDMGGGTINPINKINTTASITWNNGTVV